MALGGIASFLPNHSGTGGAGDIQTCALPLQAVDGLVDANDQFRRLLLEENSCPFGPEGDNINIRFFSDGKDKEGKE